MENLINREACEAGHSIKSIPKEERPYEKCRKWGPEYLSDAELLAIILRTGAKGESVLDLARTILSDGNGNSSLLSLYHRSIADMTKIRGLGSIKAVQLKCIAELSRRIARTRFSEGISFHDPQSVSEYYMEVLRHEEQELVMLVMLNSKGRLICDKVLSKGTVRASVISPREIFIEALKNQAVSILILHNHPSGIPDPSDEDILLTERIRQAGMILGIELLDHIIIGDCQAVSLREQGIWQNASS